MEKIGIVGNVKITHFDKNGKILEVEEGHNLVVNEGLEFMAKLLNGVSVAPFKYVQIGIGTDAPESGDDVLGTPITSPSGMAIQLGTCSYVADNIAKITALFTNNGVATINVTEAGIFDAASSGDILCRKTFGAKAVTASEGLLIEWQITVSSS